jgi:hypothetical protein
MTKPITGDSTMKSRVVFQPPGTMTPGALLQPRRIAARAMAAPA